MRAKSLGDLYIKGLESKGMSVLDTKHTGFRSAEFKAADTTHQTDETTGGGEGYAPLTTQVDQQGVFAYQRPLTIARPRMGPRHAARARSLLEDQRRHGR